MIKYESVTIGVTFSTKKSFNEKFQKTLDEYSEKGWKLHSFHFSFEICTMVFEKEQE